MVEQSASKILIVEDEDVIRELLSTSLRRREYVVLEAPTRAKAVAHLKATDFDLLLVDKNLPDGSGFDVIDAAAETRQNCEIIVITAYSDTDSAIQAVSLGVFRYVRKPFDLKALLLDIDKALETGRLRTDLARRTRDLELSNRALVESKERYRMLFNSGNDAVFVYPFVPDGPPRAFIEVNDVACHWLGYSRDELLRMNFTNLHPNGQNPLTVSHLENLLKHKHILYETEIHGREGRKIPVEISTRLFELGQQLTVLDIVRDVTERKRSEEEKSKLEEQFREAQKMEAVGRLAGGVAHDMNNVLGAIMGFAAALEQEIEATDEQRSDIRGILEASRKGRDLTRDLLGFARKGKYLKESISFNAMAADIQNILTRTIPKTIVVETDLQTDLKFVEGDSGQLNHAVMNICLNAVDALQGRGVLTLCTRNIPLENEDAKFPDLHPGEYVSIQIRDNGQGMEPETLERAFEPFFTTKPQGQGTGLGLAMAYGAVNNHKGRIHIESALGQGTTVTIYLPALSDEDAQNMRRERMNSYLPPPNITAEKDQPKIQLRPKERKESMEQKTSGTVLLVDDEPMIRNAGKRLLSRLGFRVLLATNGEEAIEQFKNQRDEIKFIVLDLIMPVMNGEEAFSAIHAIDPNARVLLSSGFSKEEKAEELLRLGAAGFIQKPFDLKTLTRELEKIHVLSEDPTETTDQLS